MAGEVTNENEFVAVPFQAEISWDELKKDASPQYLKNGSHEIYAAIVPDKGYYLAAKNGYPVMDYDKFFKCFENGMPYAKFIDLTQTLSLEAYYFTDSHWRQEALIGTANQIKRNM